MGPRLWRTEGEPEAANRRRGKRMTRGDGTEWEITCE